MKENTLLDKNMESHNETWDVLKGIGILAVVLGHSGCPAFLRQFVYAFHMPLFFMISGFFIKSIYFEKKRLFIKKRVNSLYVPYIKWTIIFILLHDIFFKLNVINPFYGYMGNGSRWYSFYDIFYQIVVAATTMNNAEHLLGAFWFIKSLFVASILFVLLGSLFYRNIYLLRIFPLLILLLCFANLFIMDNKYVLYIEERFIGHFELFGLFFVSLGFSIQSYIRYTKGWWKMVISGLLLVVISIFCPVAMGPEIQNVALLPVSAVCGFVFFYNVASFIVKKQTMFCIFFREIGVGSFYILLFHFLSFKLVSLLKTIIFNIDYKMIAEHPVISIDNDFFWIVYSIVGIIGSLALGKIVSQVSFLRR